MSAYVAGDAMKSSSAATLQPQSAIACWQDTPTAGPTGFFDRETWKSLYSDEIWAETKRSVHQAYVRRTRKSCEFVTEDDTEKPTTASLETLADNPAADNLQSLYFAEIAKTWAEVKKTHQAYVRRIEQLREFAAEDDECSSINEASEEDFWWFIQSIPWASKAGLGLLDNGNLCAIREGERKMRVEIEFLGDRSCEYILFKQREGAREVSRVGGIDTLDGFRKQIRAFGISLQESV